MAPSDVVRPARRDDAARLHELHETSVRALCSGHYSAEIIDGWLANRGPWGYLDPIARGDLFVVERAGRIIGFGEAVPGTVIAVYVDPPAIRQGVGRAILRHALAQARRDHAGPVRLEATLNARDFYAREGFREVGRGTVRRNQVEIPTVYMEHD